MNILQATCLKWQAAETGSGKTGAFCLPILQIVAETIRDLAANKGTSHGFSSGAPHSAASAKCRMNLYDRGDAIGVSCTLHKLRDCSLVANPVLYIRD